jgi:hypothetical protein
MLGRKAMAKNQLLTIKFERMKDSSDGHALATVLSRDLFKPCST